MAEPPTEIVLCALTNRLLPDLSDLVKDRDPVNSANPFQQLHPLFAFGPSLLVVIDGAEALRKAVVEVFGARALIQRCREHKKRNVTEALPERLRASVRVTMNQAYATREPKRARRLLDNLARRLEHQHPGAAASLREGLDDTLTVMRLGLAENLERVLSSTNLIENLFRRVREIGRRVRRWQSGTMVLRWAATGVLEAERGFRKLAGYRAMPTLVAALRTRDAQFGFSSAPVDATEKAA
jgi:putative transposase